MKAVKTGVKKAEKGVVVPEGGSYQLLPNMVAIAKGKTGNTKSYHLLSKNSDLLPKKLAIAKKSVAIATEKVSTVYNISSTTYYLVLNTKVLSTRRPRFFSTSFQHGKIITNLNRVTWDNWLISFLRVVMAVMVIYGFGTLITSYENIPEIARRRRELEAAIEERAQTRPKSDAASVDIDIEANPELDESRGTMKPRRIPMPAFRKRDTLKLAY